MKRLALVGAVAIAFLATGAQGADTFAVHLVSQTSTTITLGWTAQPGFGYLFSTNGQLQSRTNDAARNNVKFGKVTNGVYEVAVIVKGATGTYPPPAPPPPKSQCEDKVDNDSDGKIDFPVDPGCSSLTDNDETNPVNPPTGQVFMAPNGNDANTCSSAAPCKTMQRAASVAQNGNTVTMVPGAYGASMTLANVQKQVTFVSSGTVTFTGQIEIRCTTGVTVSDVSAKNLVVAAGNKALVVRDSAFGGGTYSPSVEDDPVVIGTVGSCSGGNLSDGVLLDNVRIHDYFWQQNTGSAHTDCLQFFGGSANVTIRNSVFERCAESFIGAFPDFGNITNTVVEDTVFRNLWTNTGKGTFFAMQWGCPGHSGTVSGTVFRRTTWSPDVSVPIRTDCPNFTVENNTFQTGPGQDACDDWDQRWGGTVVWRNNTFLNGNGCTT